MLKIQKNMMLVAQALIEGGADFDEKTGTANSVWEALESGGVQSKAYKVFMEWAEEIGFKPGVGSLEKLVMVKQGLMPDPKTSISQKHKRDFVQEEKDLLESTILHTLERELTDANDYSVEIYKVPKDQQPLLGGPAVALFTDQGAWWGAASYANKIVVGSIEDILATAREYLKDAGKDFSDIGKGGTPLVLHSMNELDTVSDEDDFTLSGAKVGDLIVYQHGENGIGLATEAEYEELLEVTRLANPGFTRNNVNAVDLDLVCFST